MTEQFYTAKEAAALLGLKYHTLLARAHKSPTKYPHEKIGWALVFHKNEIDKRAAKANASASKTMAGTTR